MSRKLSSHTAVILSVMILAPRTGIFLIKEHGKQIVTMLKAQVIDFGAGPGLTSSWSISYGLMGVGCWGQLDIWVGIYSKDEKVNMG